MAPSILSLNFMTMILMALMLSFSDNQNIWAQDNIENEYWVYFGTYTGGDSEGIYATDFNAQNGETGAIRLVAKTTQPSFVALHPSGKFLYAVNETVEYHGKPSGYVTSFSIDPETADLKELNQQASLGGAPCHLVVDHDGKYVLVANYVGGNVVSLAVQNDGRLAASHSSIQHEGQSVNPKRQEGPHAHSVNLDSSGKYAIAADLGPDRLYVHQFDRDLGKLSARPENALALSPGAGPRHFAFHPDGKHAFVINELHSTLTALAWDAKKGQFEALETQSTLPGIEVPGNSTAEVVVHPSGKWVYGSNRGHDSLAIFRWDGQKQKLGSAVGHQKTLGKTPRNFAIDPTGRYLFAANQSSGYVTVFKINQNTGGLSEVRRLSVPNPVCVRFLPR
ncbi:MAG: lactonase family protein [Planctomycetota bacterium]|nr:lactonase family protein [Planctomycetota bacterium]